MSGEPRKKTRVHTPSSGRALAYLNPLKAAMGLWAFKSVIRQLTRRRIFQRYKGSHLGLAWCVLEPLAMICVYTFVFSVIFKTRWYRGFGETYTEYALVVFAGLIPFSLFSDVLTNAPNLVPGNRGFVKKVAFPLEVLPVVEVGSQLSDALIRCLVLLVVTVLMTQKIYWTIIFLPVLFIPLLLFCLGLAWFFAALGVYVRDMGHFLKIIAAMLFFLTPIVYPITSVPESLRPFLLANPLCLIISYFRDVILWDQLPGMWELCGLTGACLVVAMAGYAFFMKQKSSFVDMV